jgi:Xaa-Pro aminopeptidase
MRAGTPGCPEIQDWLADSLPELTAIGIDPYLHTVGASRFCLLSPQLQKTTPHSKCLQTNFKSCTVCSAKFATPHVIVQVDSARKLKEKLETAGKSLVPLLEGNLVDNVWGEGRPAAPMAPLRVHKLEFAGKTVSDKLSDMRSKLEGQCSCQRCRHPTDFHGALLPNMMTHKDAPPAS